MKDLVKFGPNWTVRSQVDDRVAKAKDLLDKAEAEQDVVKALALYKQAAEQNPYGVDIPTRKAKRFQDREDRKYYGQALGEILAIEPNNLSALNNAGVVAALDRNFGSAVLNLSKAAALGDNATTLNNLAQAIYMKVYGEEIVHNYVREEWVDDYCVPACRYNRDQWKEILHTGVATLKTMEHPNLRQATDRLHQLKVHVTDEYWGDGWAPVKDFAAFTGRNKLPFKDLQNQFYIVKAIDARWERDRPEPEG